jgi:hypothetical protein
VPDSPVLAVLGELVVDLLPVTGADAGPEGTAPQYVARLNCTRVGVDPPTHAELEAARSTR